MPAWFSSLGTVGALYFAFWRYSSDRRIQIDQANKDQAAKITAWIEESHPETRLEDGTLVDGWMIVSNASTDAISQVVVSFDILKTLPIKTPYIVRGEDLEIDEFLYAMLPPGVWRMPVPTGWRGMNTFPGVIVAFTDSRNHHWTRMTDGALLEESMDVIKRRGIRFPQRISIPDKY